MRLQVALVLVDHVRGDERDNSLYTSQHKQNVQSAHTQPPIKLTFHNQFEAVESPTPRDRMGNGKISPTTTHATPPQQEAKKKMYIATKAI